MAIPAMPMMETDAGRTDHGPATERIALVACADAAVQATASKWLATAGFEIAAVTGIGSALDALSRRRPALVVTVGLAPASMLLGIRRLTDAIGKSYVLGNAVAIPLPHPSGASGWLNDVTNRARLGKALTHLRRELERVARDTEVA